MQNKIIIIMHSFNNRQHSVYPCSWNDKLRRSISKRTGPGMATKNGRQKEIRQWKCIWS